MKKGSTAASADQEARAQSLMSDIILQTDQLSLAIFAKLLTKANETLEVTSADLKNVLSEINGYRIMFVAHPISSACAKLLERFYDYLGEEFFFAHYNNDDFIKPENATIIPHTLNELGMQL